MSFPKPFFRLGPKGMWKLPKRAYLSILSLYMMTMSFISKIFSPKGLAEADETKRKKFLSAIKQKCKPNALRRHERFLPQGKISSLVTTTAVRPLMPGASDDLIEFVCSRAKKVFLTTLHINHDKVHAAMSSFYAHKMTDDRLPIEDPMKACGVCMLPTEGECRHKTDWPHFSDWECCDVSAFHRDQWIFCAPVFSKTESLLELEESHILPFTSKERGGKGGHFSTVCKAGIHVDHYPDYPDSNKAVNGEIQVALKELKDLDESGYNVKDAWMSEAKALNQINQLHLKHLIRQIGSFKKGDSYYIMFEWADGGNLRDLWRTTDLGGADLNGHRIMKVLEQLHGLAEALSKLHNKGNRDQTLQDTPQPVARTETLLKPPSQGMPKIQVQAENGSNANTNKTGEEHWRHGDLKPDNILLFKDASSPWLGTLKIADLGLAKQHEFATSKRVEATGQRYSTSQYEAPEVVIKRDAPRSRLYDIWSMGCIIFEFVIWLLYGSSGLQKFYRESPQIFRGIGTLYFTAPTDDSAHVSDVVKKWMDHILKSDPECNGKSPSALRDLIELVKDHLLVVALPRASVRTRGDAELLENRLRCIMEEARADKGGNYLFTGSSRKGVQIPETMGSVSTGSVGQVDVSRRQHLYFDDTWNFVDDSSFATNFLLGQDIQLSRPSSPQTASLCESCTRLTLVADGVLMKDTFENIKKLSKRCQLHDLVLGACSFKEYHETSPIELCRIGHTFKVNGEAISSLSICKSLTDNTSPDPSADVPGDIRIGLPRLLEVGSEPFYSLMLHWLYDCDLNHTGCRPLSPDPECLPARLLDVGQDGGLSTDSLVYLRVTENLEISDGLRYIALSHPWGNAEDHDHFCTTVENREHRLRNGIAVSQLPDTFKHAVQVTRSLNIQYLWIDSLCIAQGDGGEFDAEAKNMEAIFSSAYCVMAASRAAGTSSGFLGQRPARKFIRIDGFSGSPHYICEAIDDFQHDVIEGDLNKRGWVLQERALARRTIYFTKNQTYWECGQGVRCETLARMVKQVQSPLEIRPSTNPESSNEAAFLGDPNFPDVAIKSSKGARIRLYQKLYERYSRLDFTKAYDRPIAIAGLEQRLVNAFETHGGYGIFEGKFFGRSLLWIRDASFTDNLRKIEFPSSQKYVVPTWSWMAYEGAITFMKVPFNTVEWEGEKDAIRSPWTWSDSSSTSTSWHTGNSNERIDLTANARDFLDPTAAEREIIYDQGYAGLTGGSVKCVIVGKEKSRDETGGVATRQHYYVLVVAPRGDSGNGYERVGAASLPGTCIAWGRPVLKVRIV